MCQNGTPSSDYLHACVETTDGNVVVAGFFYGYLNGTRGDGASGIVAVKLDVNSGNVMWTYQVRRTTQTL